MSLLGAAADSADINNSTIASLAHIFRYHDVPSIIGQVDRGSMSHAWYQ